MAIVSSEACPACQEAGHDKTGNHLLVFEDGGRYCGKKDYHKTGEIYFVKGLEDYIQSLKTSEVSESTRYLPTAFRELEKLGKLDNPNLRAIVLSNMKKKHQFEVGTEAEREALMAQVELDKAYFDALPVRNLVARGIRGDICRKLDVHVGLDADGKVCRHYYPQHTRGLKWMYAKCRAFDKDFGFHSLGIQYEPPAMGGMAVTAKVGGRKKKLLVVGGELDWLSAYQMLQDNDPEGRYPFHVWYPPNGEDCLQNLIDNKAAIDAFEEIVWGLDNDAVGRAANLAASRLFRGKSKFLVYPSGCKDANDCLMNGQESEFINAWFHPVESFGDTSVTTIDDFYEELLEDPEGGLSWFNPQLDKMTFKIRLNSMYLVGAGSGVGKTEFTKQVMFDLMMRHKQKVGVIYLEEPVKKTYRSYASYFSDGRRFDLPPDTESDDYRISYSKAEAQEAVDKLQKLGLLHVADLKDKAVDSIMKCIDDFVAMGIQYIAVDNLTAFELKGASKVDAIDAAVKRLGSYKDENPVAIFLLAHVKRVNEDVRTPFNYGGRVYEHDFKGSSGIINWANYAISLRRNCFATDPTVRRHTIIECLKDRDTGMNTGMEAHLESCNESRIWRTAPEREIVDKKESKDKKKSGDLTGFDF